MSLKKIALVLTFGVALLVMLAACHSSDVKLNHIYIAAETYKVAPGDTLQLSLHAYPEDANTGFPNDTIVWSSSDTTLAEVNQSGRLVAKRYGVVNIVVTFGPLTAKKEITISSKGQFADQRLLSFLLERFDTNSDGVLEGYETATYNGIDLTGLHKLAEDVVDMSGLENFSNLQVLRIERVKFKNLNLSAFTYLTELHIDTCVIADTLLDLRFNSHLADVRIMACHDLKAILFGSYDTYGPNDLRTLHCSRCNVAELDLTRCGATLWDVDVTGNPRLSQLDLSPDSMIHSVNYSCAVTNITWPTNIEMEYVLQYCE